MAKRTRRLPWCRKPAPVLLTYSGFEIRRALARVSMPGIEFEFVGAHEISCKRKIAWEDYVGGWDGDRAGWLSLDSSAILHACSDEGVWKACLLLAGRADTHERQERCFVDGRQWVSPHDRPLLNVGVVDM